MLLAIFLLVLNEILFGKSVRNGDVCKFHALNILGQRERVCFSCMWEGAKDGSNHHRNMNMDVFEPVFVHGVKKW